MRLLSALEVVEVAGSASTAYCGKLLADLGGEVTRIEPPDGQRQRPQRSMPPLGGAAALGVDAAKSRRTLDLATADGRHELLRLIADADVLLIDGDAVELEQLGTTVEEVSADHPRLVITRMTAFGATGQRASWRSSDEIQYAMSCWLHATGRPDRPPVITGGRLAQTIPGLGAASASLMALRARDALGSGQVVDVSQQEALLLCQPYFDVAFGYTGLERSRTGMPFPMTIVPAADGHLGVNVLTQSQWELLCAFTGRFDLLEDDRFTDPSSRAAHAAELTEAFADWASDKERVPTFQEGQGWRIPFGFVPHLDEVPAMEQHVARSFMTRLQHPSGRTSEYPGVPFLVNGERPAPARVEGVDERPVARRDATPSEVKGPATVTTTSMAGGPLAGVRIVDLSMFWSGPLTAALFAQYGAEVTKVESVQRVDGWRGMADNPSIEHSHLFNSVNLNKRGITLDLTAERGRDLLRPLVEEADALVENFSPRVMGNFGLTDAVLHEWNPELIILSMPAFGLTGPWRDYVGFAPTIEQLSGLPELTGLPDGPPTLTGNSVADPSAGLAGCFALLAALHARGGAGRGAHLDLSQLEALTSLVGPALLEHGFGSDGGVRPADGDDSATPHGCHPCAGDDRWIVIAIPDAAAWQALAAVAGRGWEHDERFQDEPSRRAHAVELHEAISSWSLRLDNIGLAEELQRRGVPAAPVLRPSQLHDDAHLISRGSYKVLDHPVVGPKRYPVLPFRFSSTPGAVYRPGPTLGQDNDAVLGGEAGLSAAALASLRADKVIGEGIEG